MKPKCSLVVKNYVLTYTFKCNRKEKKMQEKFNKSEFNKSEFEGAMRVYAMRLAAVAEMEHRASNTSREELSKTMSAIIEEQLNLFTSISEDGLMFFNELMIREAMIMSKISDDIKKGISEELEGLNDEEESGDTNVM